MKGLKIIKAKPSNAIDIYPLFVSAAKEGCFDTNPSGREVKMYYFKSMIDELAHPLHVWLLARRGRGYLGYLHAVCIPGRWDGGFESMFIEVVYVDEKYRNRGVCRKLIEELKKEADHIGIKQVKFSCPEHLVQHWVKRGAEKTRTLMRLDV